MRPKACPHCGGPLAIPWPAIESALRDGEETLVGIARRYGVNEESVRRRRDALGLPLRNTPPGVAIGRAEMAQGIRELREARRLVEDSLSEYRRMVGELRR